MTENGQGGVPQPGTPHQAQPVPAPGYPQQPGPQPGEAWGTPPAYGYPAAQDPQAAPAAQEYSGPYESAYEPPPQPGQPAYGYPPPAGHVVGPGFEGPGDPHGYGYPPLPDAATQYIPPVPPGPAAPHEQATQYIPPVQAQPHEQATQYIPPVEAGPGAAHEQATQYIPPVPAAGAGDAATQYIPPVQAAPAAPHEQATQYIPPVPAAGAGDAATQYIPPVPAAGLHEQATQHIAQVPAAAGEAATQYIPPVPAGAAPAAGPAEEFDALFRADGDADAAGHTQQLPPVRDPGPRRTPPPAPPQRHGPPQQQYAPPPPPPPAPARRIPPAVIAAAVFGLVVAGLGVGALLSDGKAQNTDPGAVAPAASGSANSGAAPGEEAVDPARPQAVQLDKLLEDASDSRTAVIKAVDDIKDCKNLTQAAQDLREAARQREGLVTRLQELKIDLLPNHARLSASLTKAWKASADADNSYADWADDVARDKGGCGGKDDKDDKGKGDGGDKDGKAKVTDDAQDGNKSSAEATRAKESAATMWNTIAAKYGLTKRDKSQL
ncbi:hypothetical protein [Streptomyces lavendulae]|uniref:hypothetical protein n=1 Tax=Streptomyces lavendulae TaxID=1914 RepID=UPI0024A13875|nr:hypothetical protein [Streptomyces lavendulae]GLX18859.1 hypothetical protein Slala01_25030 [Streptomyces lavendulae subsp. lavendulae]